MIEQFVASIYGFLALRFSQMIITVPLVRQSELGIGCSKRPDPRRTHAGAGTGTTVPRAS